MIQHMLRARRRIRLTAPSGIIAILIASALPGAEQQNCSFAEQRTEQRLMATGEQSVVLTLKRIRQCRAQHMIQIDSRQL